MEERQPYGQMKILATTSVNGMLGPGSLTLETIQQVNPRDETSNQKKKNDVCQYIFLKLIGFKIYHIE
jgi:protein regulator of cytokinesis 1